MDLDCIEWVTENLYMLEQSRADDCRYIYSIFLLLCDVENDGFGAYLINSSSDYFSSVSMAFKSLNFSDATRFVADVEDFFGGTVPKERDERIDYVLPFLQSREDGPIEILSASFDRLIPQVEKILRDLVAVRKDVGIPRVD